MFAKVLFFLSILSSAVSIFGLILSFPSQDCILLFTLLFIFSMLMLFYSCSEIIKGEK